MAEVDVLNAIKALSTKLDTKADRNQVGDQYGSVIARVELARQHAHADTVAILAALSRVLDAVTNDSDADVADQLDLHASAESSRHAEITAALADVRAALPPAEEPPAEPPAEPQA